MQYVIIFILIVLVIIFWQYLLALAVIFGIGFLIYKIVKNRKLKQNALILEQKNKKEQELKQKEQELKKAKIIELLTVLKNDVIPYRKKEIASTPVLTELAHFKVAGVTYYDLKKMIKFAKDNMLYDPYDGYDNQDIKDESFGKYYEINIDDQFEYINFVQDPENKHDPNAIKVNICLRGKEYMIGYVPEYINKKIARILKKYGSDLHVNGHLTGGKYKEAEYVDDDYDDLISDKEPKMRVKTHQHEYGFNVQIYVYKLPDNNDDD